MDRWISNTNEIHSDCIWNHGAPEMSAACRLETVGTKASHTSSAPVVSNCTRVSERPPCSSDRVEKYFESKRRNARIARKQSGVLENEWVAHQQKLNETIISSVEKRSKKQNDASVALPYTSLVKEKNPCSKSQNPTPAWPANGVDDQKVYLPSYQRSLVADTKLKGIIDKIFSAAERDADCCEWNEKR